MVLSISAGSLAHVPGSRHFSSMDGHTDNRERQRDIRKKQQPVGMENGVSREGSLLGNDFCSSHVVFEEMVTHSWKYSA